MIYLMSNHASVWKLRRNGHDVGWMIGADGWRKPTRDGTELPYALDNGMYFPHGSTPQSPQRLCEFFGRVGKALAFHAPLFAIVPDMPYSAEETIRRWTFWHKQCEQLAPAWRWGLAVQDGMTPIDLDRLAFAASPDRYAVCVGGSSSWKDATIPMWAKWCRESGVWCHVLRVNNPPRIQRCQDEGVGSVDGTGLFPGGCGAAEACDMESGATVPVVKEAP